MILNRLKPGTKCTVIKTGEKGVLKQIYFYPTKFEIEFQDGRISHYTTKQLEIDGITQVQAKYSAPSIPKNRKGESWSRWFPFQHDSVLEHHFSTTKEIMWKTLTSLEMYNIWFFGIQRALPINNKKRYVHKYSFEHFNLSPGKYFKVRPKSLAPYFTCRIMTLEKESAIGFSFSTNPFLIEYVQFTISETKNGVWVKCSRNSTGLASIFGHFNWQQKSKILESLDKIVPKTQFEAAEIDNAKKIDITSDKPESNSIASLDTAGQVAFLVNKSLDGNMDFVNNHDNKVIRAKAKAMIIKIKKGTIERPPMPEINNVSSAPSASGGIESLDNDQLVAYLVNKGLDGDMDSVSNFDNKVIRAKAKAMIVKINRGSVERPPMPEINNVSSAPSASGGIESLDNDQLVAYLVNKGLDGDMDSVSNFDNKVIRAKAKAMIVKINRGSVERPPMPEITGTQEQEKLATSKTETDEELIKRLVAKGLEGDLEEINKLENKVIRGKIKATIVKQKRKIK